MSSFSSSDNLIGETSAMAKAWCSTNCRTMRRMPDWRIGQNPSYLAQFKNAAALELDMRHTDRHHLRALPPACETEGCRAVLGHHTGDNRKDRAACDHYRVTSNESWAREAFKKK